MEPIIITDESLINKTIERVEYDESGSEDKIILWFNDNTAVVITTNASNFLYSLFIYKRK